MRLRALTVPLATLTLLLAACGGSSDSGGDAVPGGDDPASSNGSGSDAPAPDDASGDPVGETGANSDWGGAPLRQLFSLAMNTGALNAAVVFSPDGTELALLTGGFEPVVEIYDVATGTLSRSAGWNGQGLGIFWTSDDRLVGYNPARIYASDATSLEPIEGIEATLGPEAERCSTSPFHVRHDVAGNALFGAQSADVGGVVCRIDLGTMTTTATPLPDAGGFITAFLRPDGSEVVVGYNMGGQLGQAMATVLDAVTLTVISTEPVPDGGIPGGGLKAVTNDDLVVPADRFTDQLARAGTVLPVEAIAASAGPYIAGNGPATELVLMDSTGAVVASGAEGFQPFAVSADGSTVAVLLAGALAVYATS